MILEKLLKTKDPQSRTIVHPLYQLFPNRLELIYFDEVKIVHGTHHDFKITIRNDMEKNGLLCPMVLDENNYLKSGNHRFKILTKNKLANASLFYKTKNDKETFFFSKLNIIVWMMHTSGKPPTDFEFLFKPPMQKHTERCFHLLQEGVKKS